MTNSKTGDLITRRHCTISVTSKVKHRFSCNDKDGAKSERKVMQSLESNGIGTVMFGWRNFRRDSIIRRNSVLIQIYK